MKAELLLAKAAAAKALRLLADTKPDSLSLHSDVAVPREMKAAVDEVIEDAILECLRPSGLGFLSEEAGQSEAGRPDDLRWVVDPLDGTVNFVRGIAPCAVSVALCYCNQPVLGVIGEFPSGKIAWGGRTVGAFLEGRALHVSDVSDKRKAVLCTGFPSRFDFSEDGLGKFIGRVKPFGKVRMLGAASLSLLQVAKGAADAYAEQDIMIWDVAAGLAIVEGAGGWTNVTPGRAANALGVLASNGCLAM